MSIDWVIKEVEEKLIMVLRTYFMLGARKFEIKVSMTWQ